jgi:Family of unknown function (DUF7002)
VTEDEFAARFPRVYHVAEAGSWPGIARHGLLSTSALLDLYGVDGGLRERLEGRRRAETHVLEDPEHGRAVLRDQKPLSEEKLAACAT